MVTLAVVLAMVGFVLRVYAPGPITETFDEQSWLERSDAFRTALVTHDFAEATAAHHARIVLHDDTMPGVTTMWAGTIGRAVAVAGGELGVTAKVVGPSEQNADVLRAGRTVVALWCSIALGLFVYLAWRLFGRGTAFVAGVLLATEPWLVGHSDILQTDAMVTMFSAASMLALAVGLGMSQVEQRSRRRLVIRRGWLVASAVFAALGVLTKLNALMLVVPGAVVVAAASWSHQTRSTSRRSWREALTKRHIEQLATALALWLAVAISVFVALWPAMWVAPLAQLTDMRHALHQVGAGQTQLFLGKVSKDPGPAYYFVAFLFRATLWLVAGTVVAIGLAVVRVVRRLHPRHPMSGSMRYLDRVPLWPLAICVPYLAAITWSAKKFDRYLLPVFPFAALVTGAIVSAAVVVIADRYLSHTLICVTAVAVAIGLCVATAVQAPYAISYVDPLVGGQRVGSHVITLGWEEGIERLGATIQRERSGQCATTIVATDAKERAIGSIAVPCGRVVPPPNNGGDFAHYDYVITYITGRQLGFERTLLPMLRRNAVVVDRTRIGGVTYTELWRVRRTGPNLTQVAS